MKNKFPMSIKKRGRIRMVQLNRRREVRRLSSKVRILELLIEESEAFNAKLIKIIAVLVIVLVFTILGALAWGASS